VTFNIRLAESIGAVSSTERRIVMIVVQVVSGVIAAAVLGIIIYRRKQKAV
jgi:hypothetical protein